MKSLHMITFILVIIGGLNWGLAAIGPSFELVHYLQIDWLIKLVYILVGLSALYEAFTHKQTCKACDTKPMMN